MKKGFWTADWFAGLIITLVFVLVSRTTVLFDGLERDAYDWGVSLSSAEPSEQVAVIAIDDESIENIGRWPWSRDVHAAMIDTLAAGGAKVIGSTVLFVDPQRDPGLQHIEGIAHFYLNSHMYGTAPGEIELLSALVDDVAQLSGEKTSEELQQAVRELRSFVDESSLTRTLPSEVAQLGGHLERAVQALSTDVKLGMSIEGAENVVVPMLFALGVARGNPDEQFPEYVSRNAIPSDNIFDTRGGAGNLQMPVGAIAGLPPIPAVGSPAAAIGHVNPVLDVDGAIRSEPLVVSYYGQYYPSLALQIAAQSLNLGVKDIVVSLGESVQLGSLEIRTDPHSRMQTFFYSSTDNEPAFTEDSFYDVMVGKIPPEKYQGKVVLIGATAAGVDPLKVTPISPGMASVQTLAHSVSSILSEDFFIEPAWSRIAKWVGVLVVALYLILALPRLRAGVAFVITVVLLIGLVSTHLVLMTTQGMWVQLMAPTALLFLGHLLITTKRFLVTEKGKILSEAESAESNRMLGLAYQGKGDLDAAFASFRKIPADPSVMDLLYNLALDYERKRQHNKAGSVYQYISEADANFRDVKQRLARSRKLEETVMLGGAGASTAGGTLLLDGDDIQKPMLGRYEVEKELGKGAMGTVYLGRDPKINRVVAIKTMALSQEFEPDELDDVKKRFFREAETAGRLNHPNIVTIFDAGEEHDLAYIAMEFLKGKDLAAYTKEESLLPLPKVLEIVAKAADALAFAHGQNVVHRDIKPANIMYEPESNALKITDFGIARITDSSRTKTGMVLGTPSYMSPEQLSGKKVDGRSDIFSLGVMLFQLSSGHLPFRGDSMATLMFKIANESHPDLISVRPELPPALGRIIDKALAKDMDERYQDGAQMAKDLRECAAAMSH